MSLYGTICAYCIYIVLEYSLFIVFITGYFGNVIYMNFYKSHFCSYLIFLLCSLNVNILRFVCSRVSNVSKTISTTLLKSLWLCELWGNNMIISCIYIYTERQNMQCTYKTIGQPILFWMSRICEGKAKWCNTFG